MGVTHVAYWHSLSQDRLIASKCTVIICLIIPALAQGKLEVHGDVIIGFQPMTEGSWTEKNSGYFHLREDSPDTWSVLSPRDPQWDSTSVAHRNKLLKNTPFICFPFSHVLLATCLPELNKIISLQNDLHSTPSQDLLLGEHNLRWWYFYQIWHKWRLQNCLCNEACPLVDKDSFLITRRN